MQVPEVWQHHGMQPLRVVRVQPVTRTLKTVHLRKSAANNTCGVSTRQVNQAARQGQHGTAQSTNYLMFFAGRLQHTATRHAVASRVELKVVILSHWSGYLTCSCPTPSGASAACSCQESSASCSCCSMWGVHLSERSPRTKCTTVPGGGRVNTSQ
jgi:hypothetical protein